MSDCQINFIGIGGQKCASTWIYDILAGHPEVCLSQEKELDFFSNFWDRGFNWYADQFDAEKAKAARIVGEVSPLYLADSDAPVRAAQYNPDMKLIVTFRNPIERAFSNHKHNIRQGFVNSADLSFEAAMASNPTYVEYGNYGKHLSNWLRHFPRSQVLILFFDDIVTLPSESAQSVYRFLGIAEDFKSPAIQNKSNESVAVANVKVARLVDHIRKAVRSSPFSWAWGGLRLIGLRALYRKLNMRNVDAAVPKMQLQTRRHLVELYKTDIALLEAITGRSLSTWIKTPE